MNVAYGVRFRFSIFLCQFCTESFKFCTESFKFCTKSLFYTSLLRAWLLELPLVSLWLVQLSTYLDLQNNMRMKSMMVIFVVASGAVL